MCVRAFSIGGGRYMWSAVMLRGYFLMPKGGIMYRDGAAFHRLGRGDMCKNNLK